MALTREQLAAQQSEYDAAHREMDAAEATQVAGVTDAVKKGAAAFGRALLGHGTEKDATQDGTAYKLHLEERRESGETPMTREEFIRSRQQPTKG